MQIFTGRRLICIRFCNGDGFLMPKTYNEYCVGADLFAQLVQAGAPRILIQSEKYIADEN
jgi:hypothetical protein